MSADDVAGAYLSKSQWEEILQALSDKEDGHLERGEDEAATYTSDVYGMVAVQVGLV